MVRRFLLQPTPTAEYSYPLEMSFGEAAHPAPANSSFILPENGIDLKKLSNDTSEALKALEPFYTQKHKWYLLAPPIVSWRKSNLSYEVYNFRP